MASGSLQYVLVDLRDVTFFDIDGLEVIQSLNKFCTKKNNMVFGIRVQKHKNKQCHKMLEINDFFSNEQLQEYFRNQEDTEDDDLCVVLEKLQENTPEGIEDEKKAEEPAADDDYKQEAWDAERK